MADRESLREFQVRLSERLRHAASSAGQSAWLGIEVDGRRMLVDLSEAGEIAPNGTTAAVPLTHDWFRGLVNLRGSLYGVSDLGRFAGGKPAQTTKATRLLAFSPRLNLNGAIVVDRMLGLQNTSTMSEETAADETAPSWMGRRWIDAEGNRWTELSLERLASDERFLAVNR